MSRLHAPALLVGSVPLGSVAEVMTACAGELGDVVDAFPDGELGDRINWVFYLAVRTYRAHPDLETVQDHQGDEIRQPRPGASLEERASSTITFKLRPGVESIEFGDLHYAAPAIESYDTFVRLREAGMIAPDARFQVALPSAGSAVPPFFAEPEHWDMVCRAYREAARREIERMVESIPAEDLVVQFDIAVEVRDLYLGDDRSLPWAPDRSADEKWAWHLEHIGELAGLVPNAVVLGYHLCFGTWGGWPHTPGVEEADVCVRLANEIVARSPRAVDYIHVPILPDADESFMAPLADLDVGDARIYLGLVYHDGADGCRRRIELARPLLEDFGVAWYCGFGRLPADEVRPILHHIRNGARELQAAARAS